VKSQEEIMNSRPDFTTIPDGWFPEKLLEGNRVRWVYLGTEAFTEPFFTDTVSARLHFEPNQNRREAVCSVDEFLKLAKQADAVEPSAFIFHISRCGSTLLSQLLSRDERCIVLSEVPFLDQVLRFPFPKDDAGIALRQKFFRAALHLLGRNVNGKQKFLFIKTDSWHIMFFDLIRQMYPHVPVVLLYRSPAEVMRSQDKLKGMHAVPGVIEPELFGFDPETVQDMMQAAYLGRVLERYFEEYLRILESDSRAYPINYHDGVMEMVKRVAEISQVRFDDVTLAGMQERAGTHAKFPEQVFARETTLPEQHGKPGELFNRLKQMSADIG